METVNLMINGSLAKFFKFSGTGGKGEARLIASTALWGVPDLGRLRGPPAPLPGPMLLLSDRRL